MPSRDSTDESLGPFGPADLVRIEERVRAAEARTRGEIVLVIAQASDRYAASAWLVALTGSLLGLLTALLQGPSQWGTPDLATLVTGVVVGGMFGIGLWLVPAMRRTWIGTPHLRRCVHRSAEVAFLEEEVFATAERTGVLLYLSLFEREAVVLADQGIHDQVDPHTWVSIVRDLAAAMRENRAVEGVEAAVDACAGVLTLPGLEPDAEDADELGNRPRLRP